MSGKVLRGILFGILLIFIFSIPVLAIHQPVQLMTEDGKMINPLTGQNPEQPYSPKNSCGSCHSYNTITKGYHFQQEFNIKDESKGLEADCLICHLPDYNLSERTKQVESHNYKWAATAGAGLGIVSGELAEGEVPKVAYDLDKFNSEGKVKLLIGSTEDKNCLSCHGAMEVEKRGFSWHDELNPDVHNEASLSCTHCHTLIDTEETPKIEHQIAKGSTIDTDVALDYNDSMISCETCHSDLQSNTINAPLPQHKSIKASHLDFISCEACHIPFINRAAAGTIDASTGTLVTLPNVQEADDPGDEGKWQPVFVRREDGKIYPVNQIQHVWWGNKDSAGKIVPLQLEEIKPAYEKVKKEITDDNGDSFPEVNTKKEITAMIGALASILKKSEQYAEINPLLVKGGKVYYQKSSGDLGVEDAPLASAEYFSVSHNVAPKEEALGAQGCNECHNADSRWAIGKITEDPFRTDIIQLAEGQVAAEGNDSASLAVFTTQGSLLGISPSVLGVHGAYQHRFKWFLFAAILGVLIFCLIHYVIIGPNEKHLGKLPREIIRYTVLERWTHNLRMASCLLLTLTGAGFALYSVGFLDIIGGYSAARTVHILLGILFTISTISATVIWFKKCIFEPDDLKWLKVMGGYLTKKECHPPAGCFNAGQKLFYWISTLLSLVIIVTGILLSNRDALTGNWLFLVVLAHGGSALALVAAVAAHAYLGSFANPGTWKVLLDGKVAKKWAEIHHPKWRQEERKG